MAEPSKGQSPFYPGQPVPVELFVGRSAQIEHIVRRGVDQVAHGKPVAMFVQGEYGIGKSSIAAYAQRVAESQVGLHGVYVQLGGVESLDDLAAAVVEATLRSGAFQPRRSEIIRSWLAKYIGKQELFGLALNFAALADDAPGLSRPAGMLDFLGQIHARLSDAGIKGVFLVLDEINGIAAESAFAHFVKGIVDQNALGRPPLPLLLMLCGVEERRREMIRSHQPIDRLFDVVEIEPMNDQEVEAFFTKAFDTARITVAADAMRVLIRYSAGFPKIMHLIGDAAFWVDRDGTITEAEALHAVIQAADEVGKKYVDQQVYRALRSEDYRAILDNIARSGLDMTFRRSEIAKGLTPSQVKKLDNFLRKMRALNVVRPGDSQGEYVFNVRMVRLYLWLQATKKPQS